MNRIYFYKLIVDCGAAPHVQDGILSLAICKPMIRVTAEVGDLIFGFAANSLHEDNRLIYVACVTKKVSKGAYYRAHEYANRNDCVYRWRNGHFEWYKGYHSQSDLEHDLGSPPDYKRAEVLLSNDFRYFGRDGTDEYKSRFRRIRDAVASLGRGHRDHLTEQLRDDFLTLKHQIWGKTRQRSVGKPSSDPQRDVCFRTKSCGVLGA